MTNGYLGKILDNFEFSPRLLFYTVSTVAIARLLHTLAWRLWFHPLASVPGPRLAAVSNLWQAWQDVVRGGNTALAIDKLHYEYSGSRY